MQVLARWTNQYGSVFKWSLMGQDILVITDPEEVYKLCSREANLPKAWALYKGLNTVSSELYNSACLLLTRIGVKQLEALIYCFDCSERPTTTCWPLLTMKSGNTCAR